MDPSDLTKRILAINNCRSLTDKQKDIKRQAVLSGGWNDPLESEGTDLAVIFRRAEHRFLDLLKDGLHRVSDIDSLTSL